MYYGFVLLAGYLPTWVPLRAAFSSRALNWKGLIPPLSWVATAALLPRPREDRRPRPDSYKTFQAFGSWAIWVTQMKVGRQCDPGGAPGSESESPPTRTGFELSLWPRLNHLTSLALDRPTCNMGHNPRPANLLGYQESQLVKWRPGIPQALKRCRDAQMQQ